MKKIIALGLLSFVLFALFKTPVALLLPYINKNPYFQAHHISGHIFSANIATMGGIDTLTYQMNFWQLLLANVSVEFEAKKGNSVVRGEVVLDLISEQVRFNDINGVVHLPLFQQYLPVLSTVEPQGKLRIIGINGIWNDVQNNPVPKQLFGALELTQLNLLGQAFGDYQLNVETQLSNIVGNIISKASTPTDTRIKFNLATAKKQLSIAGKILGKNANTKAIVEQLGIANIQRTIRY